MLTTGDNSLTLATLISTRLATTYERIRQAELAAGRSAGSVQLLAVSKNHHAASVRAAWGAGLRAFGENYLQEAITKQQLVADLDIEWHFIGRIQGNKTKAIASHFAWVHSLSDVQHAQRLNQQRPTLLPPLNVCLQVNISGELSKNGLDPSAIPELLNRCLELPHLRVRGLMAIPEPGADPTQQRWQFERLRSLRDSLIQAHLPLDTLSMGMSDDLEAAIAAGATLVRIGTAIFGPRNYDEC